MRRLRHNSLILPIYTPTLLLAICRSLLTPVLPLYVADFDVSYAMIGVALAGEELGTLLGDVPAGVLLRRLGQKRSMVGGLALILVCTALLFWAPSIPVVLVCRLGSGFGFALFNLGRHLYLAEMVQLHNRGRAIALFGGVTRVGFFIGPAVGGVIAARATLRTPFLLFALIAAVGLLTIILFVPGAQSPTAAAHPAPHRLWHTLRAQAKLLSVAGLGQLLAQTIRAGRRVIIPLFAADVLGLDVQQIGLIISIAAAVDMSLFLPAGWLMDRYGRKFAIVPSFLVQGVGMALIPLTAGFGGLLAVTCLIGFGNGLGSGTMMTLGADLAPAETRSEFLSTWRFIGDTGFTLGPVVVGGVADLLVLPMAALAMAASGLLASFVFGRLMPETLPRPSPPPSV